jgi:hypothetical protein
MKRPRLPRRRRPLDGTPDAVLFANELGRALGDALHCRPFTVKHEHVYGARPPLPRPARMAIEWEMQDGQRWRSYVPLHGQHETAIPWPRFLENCNDPRQWPPVVVHFLFEYPA